MINSAKGVGSLRRGAKSDLLDFNDNANDSQDDHIAMSVHIHNSQIDYLKTF